jgi:hypothetical protein
MEWTTEYLTEHAIALARTKGSFTGAASDQMLAELVAFGQSHGASRFLVDGTEAALDMSMLEIHERPQHFSALGLDYAARLALVFSHWTPDAVFLETVIGGKEYHRKVFVDIVDALAWLMSEKA